MNRFVAISVLALSLVQVSCTTSLRPAPDLGNLYDRAAQTNDAERNPIIVIPGVLGTVLRDTRSGRIVWGTFVGTYADPRRGDGARLVALPMRRGTPLAALRDEVAPDGVLESVRVSLLGLPVEQHAYISILRTLGAGGYRDQDLGESGAVHYGDAHFTCFQFAYDWRRDNVENAKRLHEFILEKKAYVEAELKKRYGIERDVRFDIVAHSMGGLVANYYLRYGPADLPADGSAPEITWAGARHVERLVMVGTPNAGSLEALTDLVGGMQLAFFLPRYSPTVVGTMPSVYELLPRTRHGAVTDREGRRVDLFDVATWQRFGWGLASPDDDVLAELLPDVTSREDRRSIALDHLEKSLARAQRFHAALDVPATPPPGTTLHLFSGDAVPTAAVAQVSESGEFVVAARAPGDGRVLRSSALMDERVGSASWSPGLVTPIAWSDITFVFSDHLEMTRDPSFSDNILWRLLDAPRSRDR
jgi:pimeloyl-ACP methyl ester carboxylesterase